MFTDEEVKDFIRKQKAILRNPRYIEIKNKIFSDNKIFYLELLDLLLKAGANVNLTMTHDSSKWLEKYSSEIKGIDTKTEKFRKMSKEFCKEVKKEISFMNHLNIGMNALMKAAGRGNLEIVKILIEDYDAEINAKNVIQKLTALDFAIIRKNIEVINYLRSKGAVSGINKE